MYRLSTKLAVVIGFLVILPLSLVTSLIPRAVEEYFQAEIFQRISMAGEQVYEKFCRQGGEIDTKLSHFAELPIVYQAASELKKANDSKNYTINHAWFFDRIQQVSKDIGLDFLKILDENGTLIAASGPARDQFGFQDQTALTLAAHKEGNSFFVQERLIDHEVLTLQMVKQKKTGATSVLLSGGYMIDEVFVQKLQRITGTLVAIHHSENGWITSPGMFEDLSQIKIGQNKIKIKDELYSIHFQPLCGLPGKKEAILLIGISEQDLLNLLGYIRNLSLSIGFTGVAIALLVGLIMARRLTKPISLLTQGVKSVAIGNLDTSIPYAARDEMGFLIDAFNQMTQDLKDYQQRLHYTERIAAWRDIARRMAHEIKNPLFPIQTSIENLTKAYRIQHPDFPEILETSSRIILEEVENLLRIINEFTRFARLPKPQLKPCSLNLLVQDALSLTRPQLSAIKILLKLDPALPELSLDRDLIVHQVLYNLLINALQALQEIQNPGEITILTEHNETRVRLIIADNGPGIPEAHLQSVFTPYFTTKPQGTGLGLAIVQRIVGDHNGMIWVESILGKGTQIILEFPLTPQNS